MKLLGNDRNATVATLAFLVACSGGEAARDWSIDVYRPEVDHPSQDSSPDLTAIDNKGLVELTIRDGGASDAVPGDAASGEAPLDFQEGPPVDGPLIDSVVGDLTSDLTGDGPTGNLAVWGYATASALPVLDGKGTLYLGLYGAIPPPLFPAAQVSIPADVSAPGASVKFEFYDVPAGQYQLWGFLDDNGNAIPVLAAPDPGDLTTQSVITATVTTSPVQQDIVLDEVMGATFPDGGAVDGSVPTLGALNGEITAAAIGPGDGKGAVYLSLHTQLPPAGKIAMATVGNADLSASYKKAHYLFADIGPGKFYLRAFLDDNANVDIFFGPEPDSGDLVHSAPIPLHIVGGQLNSQNIELNSVHP